jgi:hypothetical protein
MFEFPSKEHETALFLDRSGLIIFSTITIKNGDRVTFLETAFTAILAE